MKRMLTFLLGGLLTMWMGWASPGNVQLDGLWICPDSKGGFSPIHMLVIDTELQQAQVIRRRGEDVKTALVANMVFAGTRLDTSYQLILPEAVLKLRRQGPGLLRVQYREKGRLFGSRKTMLLQRPNWQETPSYITFHNKSRAYLSLRYITGNMNVEVAKVGPFEILIQPSLKNMAWGVYQQQGNRLVKSAIGASFPRPVDITQEDLKYQLGGGSRTLGTTLGTNLGASIWERPVNARGRAATQLLLINGREHLVHLAMGPDLYSSSSQERPIRLDRSGPLVREANGMRKLYLEPVSYELDLGSGDNGFSYVPELKLKHRAKAGEAKRPDMAFRQLTERNAPKVIEFVNRESGSVNIYCELEGELLLFHQLGVRDRVSQPTLNGLNWVIKGANGLNQVVKSDELDRRSTVDIEHKASPPRGMDQTPEPSSLVECNFMLGNGTRETLYIYRPEGRQLKRVTTVRRGGHFLLKGYLGQQWIIQNQRGDELRRVSMRKPMELLTIK